MKNNIEIVCSSYSKNANLWKELINSYKIYAPDIFRNFKFTIISDAAPNFRNNQNINLFYLEKDFGWSSNLIKYLNTTSSEFVFIVFDDVFLNKKINYSFFCKIVQECITKKMMFCRFRNSPLTLKKEIDNNFNFVDYDSPYRTVLSFSLVSKSILLSLLEANENAWDFEYNSPKRAKSIDIYETKKNIIQYIHVIEKGGYRFNCLFYHQLKNIRTQYKMFLPTPIYLFKIFFGLFFSKLPYEFKRLIYLKLKKLHN